MPTQPSNTNTALITLVATQRAQYHRGLLDWYRNPDPQPGLQQIRTVLQHLSTATQVEPLTSTYAIAEALAQALQTHSLAKRTAVKLTFGHLGRSLKHLMEIGETATAAQLSRALQTKQRDYLAQITPEHPLLQSADNQTPLTEEHSQVTSQPISTSTPPTKNSENIGPSNLTVPRSNDTSASHHKLPTAETTAYRNTPHPMQMRQKHAEPSVRISQTQLDWMLNQIEALNNHNHQQAYQQQTLTLQQGDDLQAALLAQRLTPIRQLAEQLQQRIQVIAKPYNKTVSINLHSTETVIQTDQIVPLLAALETRLIPAMIDAQKITLHLQRDSTHLNGQLEADHQKLGEPIRLPYRYALSHALLIEHQHNTYAIATHSLEKIIRIPQAEYLNAVTHAQITHDNQNYPLRDLESLLNGQTNEKLPILNHHEKTNLLLVKTATQGYAIPVETVVGHYSLLIKPLSKPVDQIPWITGGTCLAAGRIALHLQLDTLVNTGRL